MIKIISSGKIYTKNSQIPNSGRGVFAGQDIKKGEVIEVCPVIEISESDSFNQSGSVLVTYFFYAGRSKDKLFVALGYGSLYNHSYNPNAKYKISLRDQTITFIASDNIKKDEEITFNYKGNVRNKAQLWFETK